MVKGYNFQIVSAAIGRRIKCHVNMKWLNIMVVSHCQRLIKHPHTFHQTILFIFSTTDLPQHSEGDSHQGEQEESGQIKYSKYTEKNVPENIIGKNSGKNQLNKLPDPRFRLSKICRSEVKRNCKGNGRFSSKR